MIVQNVIPQEMRQYVARVANFKISNVKLMPLNSTSFVAGDSISFNLPQNTIIDTRSFSPSWTITAVSADCYFPPAECFFKSVNVQWSNGRQDNIQEYNLIWAAVRNWTMSSQHRQSRCTYSGDYIDTVCLLDTGSSPLTSSTDEVLTAQAGKAQVAWNTALTANSSVVIRALPQLLNSTETKIVNVSSWLGSLGDLGYVDMNFSPSLSVTMVAAGNEILNQRSGATTYTGSSLYATINILTMPSYSDSVLELLSSGEALLDYVFTRWQLTTAGVSSGTQENLSFQVSSSCLKRVWLTFRKGAADTQTTLPLTGELTKFNYSAFETTAGAISQVQMSLNNQPVDAYPRQLANIPYENMRALGKAGVNDSDTLVQNYYEARYQKFACVYNFSIPDSSMNQMSGYDTLNSSVNGLFVVDKTAAFDPLTGTWHIICESAAVLSIGAGRDLNIAY